MLPEAAEAITIADAHLRGKSAEQRKGLAIDIQQAIIRHAGRIAKDAISKGRQMVMCGPGGETFEYENRAAMTDLSQRLKDNCECDDGLTEYVCVACSAAREIEKMEEREQNYRLALAYLSKANDIPQRLAEIANEALL